MLDPSVKQRSTRKPQKELETINGNQRFGSGIVYKIVSLKILIRNY